MQVTLKGKVLEVPGSQPQVGEKAPDFSLPDLQDKTYTLTDFAGKPTILSVIPDIDTSVCALQTKRFNVAASQLTAVNFATISNNTKEQQAAWCGQEGVDMLMLHDPEGIFGESYHLMIPDFGHFARSIFVLDQEGVIRYQEIVPEIAEEPNYEKALAEAQALI